MVRPAPVMTTRKTPRRKCNNNAAIGTSVLLPCSVAKTVFTIRVFRVRDFRNPDKHANQLFMVKCVAEFSAEFSPQPLPGQYVPHAKTVSE